MPYSLIRRRGRWCVRKDGDEVLKCYESREEAVSFLTALNIATADERAEYHHTGVKLVLFPDEASENKLRGSLKDAIESAVDQLCVNILYLGEEDALADMRADIEDRLSGFCEYIEPFRAHLTGTGQFFSQNGETVFYASVNAPQFEKMRSELMSLLSGVIADRSGESFFPHIALTSLTDGKGAPQVAFDAETTLEFNALTLLWGDDRRIYPFGQREMSISEASLYRYSYNGVPVRASRRRASTRADKKYMRTVERDGKLYMVHYGDPDLPMRRSDPEARRNFLARHNCKDKKDPLAPGFWACLDWERTDEEMTATAMTTITEQQREDRLLVRMDTVSEMGGLRGKDYPDISVPDDVDVAGLMEIFGEKPVFVILPIGQINAQSRNNRIYTENAMYSLVRQVNELRPEGMRGHLRDEELSTRYDNPEIRWLRAEVHGDMVYGLAVALTKASRDYYRTAMKTNAQVGTSLFAWATMDGENVVDLDLISIDMADPRRVGIPLTAAKPKIKHEMSDRQEKKTMSSNAAEAVQMQTFMELREERTRLQHQVAELESRIERLTPFEDDARELRKLLSIGEQQSLVAFVKSQQTALAELFALFGVKDMSAFKTAVTEMQSTFAQMAIESAMLLESTVRAAIDEKIVVPSLRSLAVELVMARNPKTRQEVEAALEAVYKLPALQTALAESIAALSGGNQPTMRSARIDEDKPKSWILKEE